MLWADANLNIGLFCGQKFEREYHQCFVKLIIGMRNITIWKIAIIFVQNPSILRWRLTLIVLDKKKGKPKIVRLKSVFPYRESNPGRLGENQES